MKFLEMGPTLKGILQATNQLAAKMLSGRVFWLVVVSIVALCVLSRPFGAMEKVSTGFRFMYWSLIVVPTGAFGVWMYSLIQALAWSRFYQVALVSILFAMLTSIYVTFVSYSLLNPIELFDGFLRTVMESFPAAFIIFMTIVLIDDWFNRHQKNDVSPSNPPQLLSRLKTYPNAKEIWALHAQDHYVEVFTDEGSELLLIRFEDALKEVYPIDGIRVHRSNWVARSAIDRADLNRNSRRVKLKNGATLAVSHSRIKQLRDYLKSSAI